MPLINFESAKTIEDNREALRSARSNVLKTAEEKFYRLKEKEERAKRRGEDKWMLPSLTKKLEEEVKHKHKKHKKKKKKKRKRCTDSSSSPESSGDEEWVEKPAEPKMPETRSSSAAAGHEEWMNMPISVPTICIEEARAVSSRKKNDETKKAEQNNLLDQPGQSSRELNPYWRDGGSGLPGTSAGDRRLQRAAAERWGSLLVDAEASNVDMAGSRKGKCEKGNGGLRERRKFQRPGEGVTADSHAQAHGSTNRRWKKNAADSREPEQLREQMRQKRRICSSTSSSSDSERGKEEKAPGQQELQPLSDRELNELGARLVKAEIMGNESLAVELRKKLEWGRAARSRSAAATADEPREETVLLTKTGPGGLVYPLHPPSTPEHSGSRRRKHKMATHEEGKRVRYFADDDNFSLQEMFEREKLTTVEQQNNMFSKLAAKGTVRAESLDDVFEDRARVKESEQRAQARDRGRAIAEHKRSQRVLDSCALCIDSKLMLKHLLVAIGSKTYLCLPPHQSLTEGHCLVAPLQHVSCATQLDEDIWAELQLFRKALVAMFREMDQDVVFFETAMQLRHFPHMRLHCVPVPRETGHLAPIYFKKAILECEMEWSCNKKLVDLAGKDVRRAVPRGLPYFAVDFGLQSGFAHVIEDEQMFPRNFAQEIIGGMLDLDHSVWRKQRLEQFDAQRKKVVQFAKWWKPFDFTDHKNSDS